MTKHFLQCSHGVGAQSGRRVLKVLEKKAILPGLGKSLKNKHGPESLGI